MNSRVIFVCKIQPDTLLEIQTFNNNQFFTDQKRGVSGLISRIAWVNIFPKPCKAKFFVNFLHKLYQKNIK